MQLIYHRIFAGMNDQRRLYLGARALLACFNQLANFTMQYKWNNPRRDFDTITTFCEVIVMYGDCKLYSSFIMFRCWVHKCKMPNKELGRWKFEQKEKDFAVICCVLVTQFLKETEFFLFRLGKINTFILEPCL